MAEKRKPLSASTPPFDDPSSAADVPQPELELEDPAAPPEANGPNEPPLEPEAEPEPELEPQPVRHLLEPLAKDHLVELLRRAASRHPDVLDEVLDVAGGDPVNRKVVVHGFSCDTTTEALRSFFSQFGEVEDCLVVQNKATGKSICHGFVLFKHRSGALRAIKEPRKMIGNCMAACQLAFRRPVPFVSSTQLASILERSRRPVPPASWTKLASIAERSRMICVHNVSADIDLHKLTQFFAQFGEIEEGPLGLFKDDREKPMGLCKFVYKDVEGARKALAEPYKNFEGRSMLCLKMVDRTNLAKGDVSWTAQQLSGSLHAKAAAGYGCGEAGQVAPF